MAERSAQNSSHGLSDDGCLRGWMVLVIEDEPLIQLDLIQGLEAAGARVLPAANPLIALKLINEFPVSAAVVDFRLGNGGAGDVVDTLRACKVPFLFYTGYDVAATIAPVIFKPSDIEDIIAALLTLVESSHLEVPSTKSSTGRRVNHESSKPSRRVRASS